MLQARASVLHIVLYLTLLHLSLVHSVPTNITIDDTNGDPISSRKVIYSPPDMWNSGYECSNCIAQPDPSRVYAGTWSEGMYAPSFSRRDAPIGINLTASVTFSGTAVYVFCILTRTQEGPNRGNSNMYFFVDDELLGQYFRGAPDVLGYQYDVDVFAASGLLGGSHTLTIVVPQPDISIILLDYILYTQDDGKMGPAPPQPPPTSRDGGSSMIVNSTATPIGSFDFPSTTSSPLSSVEPSSNSRTSSSNSISSNESAKSSTSVTSSPPTTSSDTSSPVPTLITKSQQSSSVANPTGSSPPSSSSTGISPGKIAGAVFGSISAVVIGVVAGLRYLQYRRRLSPQPLKSSPSSTNVLIAPRSPSPSHHSHSIDFLDLDSTVPPDSPVAPERSVPPEGYQRSSSLHVANGDNDNNLPPYGTMPRRAPVRPSTKVLHARRFSP